MPGTPFGGPSDSLIQLQFALFAKKATEINKLCNPLDDFLTTWSRAMKVVRKNCCPAVDGS